MGGNVLIVRKKAEPLATVCKDTRLEVNADKTKYMLMFRDQNAGRVLNIKFENSSFERVEEFKHWGRTLKNPNYIQEEIKSKLKAENVCYYSVPNLVLFSCYPKI
jgi:UDP-galactopyranose mutase